MTSKSVFGIVLGSLFISGISGFELTKYQEFPGLACNTTIGGATSGLKVTSCLVKVHHDQCRAVQTTPDCQCCATVRADNSTSVYAPADAEFTCTYCEVLNPSNSDAQVCAAGTSLLVRSCFIAGVFNAIITGVFNAIIAGVFNAIIASLTPVSALAQVARLLSVPLPNGEVFGHGAPPPPIMKCPRCHSGDILLRSKPLNGQAGVRRFYASCSRFPECRAAMWMPLYDVLDAKVSPDKCTRCPSSPHLLEMDFRPGAFPLLPVHLKACLGGCDSNFMEQLGIHPIRPDGGNYQGTGSSVRPPPPRNPQASTTRPPPRNPQAPTTRPVAAAFPLRRSLPAQPPATAAPRSTSDGAIVCNCNKDAPLITVRKEGPNKGKVKRSVRKEGPNKGKVKRSVRKKDRTKPTHRPLTEGGANAATRTGPPAPSMVNNGTEKCACGLDAVRRTVLREGLNQGREFFVCPKPREEQCNFFAWADGPSVTDGNGRGGGRTAPRGRGTGTTKAPKRCGICKETGHTARTCPQK
ncbi:unnamed protein product [Cyprideis torosa]|uniref:Uncharacterized protein n=1 Tax=Cyprideis torosa TaxID=163714 RepID=A0A7R8ZN35_9CRUS|nr:unnamed protein product [Cyprideis torosa]CAG0886947.1 unnamed protein product [Cyprideis torosa]